MIKTSPQAFFAPFFPSLSPRMMVPRFRPKTMPFPFSDPNVEYFYYARSAIFSIARLWNLTGCEILFPAYSCGMEVQALSAAGADLRVYPVHLRMRVEVQDIVNLIRPQTRAIYLIHYLGFPGPVEELRQVCQERGIRLIEDCALSLFSSLGEQPLGSFGDAAVFSIYKSLPVPAGGALVTRNSLAKLLPSRRAPSFPSTAVYAVAALERYFDVREIGWGKALTGGIRAMGRHLNRAAGRQPVEISTEEFDSSSVDLKMSRFSHWIIWAQNSKSIIERRRQNYLYLRELLRAVSPPIFDELPPGVCPLFYPLVVSDNQEVVKQLCSKGIQTYAWWSKSPPGLPDACTPEVDQLRRSVVSLPCHDDLSLATLDRMAEIVKSVIDRV